MFQLRRALRLTFFVTGILAGIVATLTAYFARMIISPPRQPLWASPSDLGMPFEDVQFPARDGLRLSGWFIPIGDSEAETESEGDSVAPTLILVHGWPWNRLGTAAETVLDDIPGSSPIQLIHLAHSLHRRGYNLLMFDLRNHGQSATSPPVTFGLREADDVLGALDFLVRRGDVDQQRIGVVSFAMGANATIFALPRTDALRAVVAVQPASPAIFSNRYAYSLFGPLGSLVLRLAHLIYLVVGGLRFSAIEPAFAATGAGDTPVLYVQGTGDRWGSMDNVKYMAQHTPNAIRPLFVESNDCYSGYQYVVDNPEILNIFFREQMA
jgi:pimeloyl-ACP methyl ester carboxylesterase